MLRPRREDRHFAFSGWLRLQHATSQKCDSFPWYGQWTRKDRRTDCCFAHVCSEIRIWDMKVDEICAVALSRGWFACGDGLACFKRRDRWEDMDRGAWKTWFLRRAERHQEEFASTLKCDNIKWKYTLNRHLIHSYRYSIVCVNSISDINLFFLLFSVNEPRRKDSVNAGKDWVADLTPGRNLFDQIPPRGQTGPI